VLAPGGHITILDTPNRYFPLETHSVGLPLIQWLPAPLAYVYAKSKNHEGSRKYVPPITPTPPDTHPEAAKSTGQVPCLL